MARLKDQTLRKNYKQKVLREGKILLLEADNNQIAQILASLDNVTPDGALIFDKAIEDAKQALQKYTQGGVKQFFKNIFDDPVSKTIALATGIRGGTSQIPTAIKPYLPKQANNDISIWELVNDPQKREQMLQTFVKLFTMPVLNSDVKNLASLAKGEKLPFVSDLKKAITELIQNVSLDQVNKFAQQVRGIPDPGIAAKTNPKSTNTKTNTAASASSTTQPTSQTAKVEPTNQTQASTQTALPDSADITDFLTNQNRNSNPITGVDSKIIQKIIDTLITQKMLTKGAPAPKVRVADTTENEPAQKTRVAV